MTLAWRIEFDEAAKKELARLDRLVAKRIVSFLQDRLAIAENPRSLGQALTGKTLGSFWKYRVGDYRIIASIEDTKITILVLRVGHRRDVYR